MKQKELRKNLERLIKENPANFIKLVCDVFAENIKNENVGGIQGKLFSANNIGTYRSKRRHLKSLFYTLLFDSELEFQSKEVHLDFLKYYNAEKVLLDVFSSVENSIRGKENEKLDFNITKVEFQLGNSIQTIEYENRVLSKFKEQELRNEAAETREDYLDKLLNSSFNQYDDVYKKLS